LPLSLGDKLRHETYHLIKVSIPNPVYIRLQLGVASQAESPAMVITIGPDFGPIQIIFLIRPAGFKE
jgi:hypothetical protein